MIRFNVSGALSGLTRWLARLARFPALFWRIAQRRVVTDALPILSRSVPVVSGRLRGSFRVRARARGIVQVTSTDPAAPYIRYRRPARWGARNVEESIAQWARHVLPKVYERAAREAWRQSGGR